MINILFLNIPTLSISNFMIDAKLSSHNSTGGYRLIKFFFLCIIQILVSRQMCAQTISVTGKISSLRYSVQNASVTFIDNANTSRKFSAQTDASGTYNIIITTTSIESHLNTLPTSFKVEQNYPNPFSSSTTIPYEINKKSQIQVTIFDVLGRAVRKFDMGQKAIGMHNVIWDGCNHFGERVANGIYFYRLYGNGESQVKKMIFNGSGTSLVSLPISFTPNRSIRETNLNRNNQGATYTVKIENTSTTSPIFVPIEIPSVVIENDTTMNFSVEGVPMAIIDLDSMHQCIRGFGAASPWYRPVMTVTEVETAFGTGDGQLGFSILRLSIEPDSTLWSRYLISAKKAQEMGAIIIAAPWYAPGNMVETAAGNVSRVRYDKYAEYAAHLNSYISYMARNGITIYGISIQNEPDISDNWTSWTSNEILTFMRDYAHLIEGTKVMAPESFHFDHTFSDPILNDSLACENTDIICGHIYGGGLVSYPLAKSKNKEVWMTEHLMGENNSGFNLSWAIKLATEMNDVMNANMSAYVWWTIVRYYGPIGDGEKAANPQDPTEIYPAKGEATKKGYVISQFSRFIRPGYYRVESTINYPLLASGISATAYKDPVTSKIVLVVVNSNSTQRKFVFIFKDRSLTTTFIPYYTSDFQNCEIVTDITISDGSFTVNLEPLSITTFVSN